MEADTSPANLLTKQEMINLTQFDHKSFSKKETRTTGTTQQDIKLWFQEIMLHR